MTEKGLSERCALRVIGMSVIAATAAGMIYLKLRQAGEMVNRKRMD